MYTVTIKHTSHLGKNNKQQIMENEHYYVLHLQFITHQCYIYNFCNILLDRTAQFKQVFLQIQYVPNKYLC